MDKILMLRAQSQGSDCLLCLNGLVVCKLMADIPICLPVHEFVQSGRNRLQLLCLPVAPNAAYPGLVHADCAADVFLELKKDRGPSSLVQSQIVFQARRSAAQGDCLQDGLLLDVCIELPLNFPKWRFFDLMHSEANQADHLNIQAFLVNFFRQVKVANLPGFLSAFKMRNQELAVAYQLDLQQVHSDFESHWRDICTHAMPQTAVSDPHHWLVYPVSKASVYAVLNRQYEPLLQFNLSHSGELWSFPLHLGVLGNDVFVLR